MFDSGNQFPMDGDADDGDDDVKGNHKRGGGVQVRRILHVLSMFLKGSLNVPKKFPEGFLNEYFF
jgi:hypothetical protein